MTARTGWPVARDSNGNGSDPKSTRLATGGLIAPDGVSHLGVRRGVFADTLDPVVSGTGAMAYEVRPFRAVTMTSGANGPVIVPNDATVTVPTTPSPGSGSRWDRLYVRQHLVSGDGGSDPTVDAEIGIVQGAPSATPAVPNLPAGALPLGRALVTAGVTSTSGLAFTRDHDWTVANGGIVPDGQGGGAWWDGNLWRPIGRVARGKVTLSSGLPNANTSRSVAINFPAGRFSQVPDVNVTLRTPQASTSVLSYWVEDETTTGARLYAMRSSAYAQPISFSWTAIQD
ncbi:MULTISPECIES: hypothetical protein [unclassified Aeromicrobium]|uniref:hypothetical protein n=1 Tax=unclassified Aeromicrobium TaxID=2633570 RepID=UPI00288A19BF|nr:MULTISPECIES: hypothetical protein [unclassified Aeromicrobium]